jgi:hypothetical protein
MDLLCYEEIKYNFIEQTNECNICYEYFYSNFKCKQCVLYAVIHVSTVSILVTITAVLYAGIKILI